MVTFIILGLQDTMKQVKEKQLKQEASQIQVAWGDNPNLKVITKFIVF